MRLEYIEPLLSRLRPDDPGVDGFVAYSPPCSSIIGSAFGKDWFSGVILVIDCKLLEMDIERFEGCIPAAPAEDSAVCIEAGVSRPAVGIAVGGTIGFSNGTCDGESGALGSGNVRRGG